MTQNLLQDKIALVTGASSGIGAEIARAFGAAGARVALVGRDTGRLAETEEAVRGAGGDAHVIVSDLLDDGGPAAAVAETVAHYGALDVLVSGAGIFELGPFEESLESLDRQWAANVRAPFALSQAAMPHLRPGGSIIFLSSAAGRIGFATGVAYCVSKGAIEQLVRALAIEEAPNGVRVNAVAPGNVRTRMNAELLADADYERAMLEGTPLGRLGEVGDIAPTAVLLASDSSAFLTGQSIVIDGGWTAQ